MAKFNNRGNGNNRFGDNNGKPFHDKKEWGGKRPRELYKATCAECNKACEVPFRPMDGKPVYCKECFGKKRSNAGVDTFPKRDFNARGPEKPQFQKSGNGDVMVRQLETVNTKLDQLIRAVEALAVSHAGEKSKKVRTAVAKKNPKKKAAKK